MRRISFLCLFLLASAHAQADDHPEWTTPIPPFQIADNLFYVGSQDLASYLITTPRGNILINANLASSPAQIRAGVERLGFKWADTRILLNSQAHFDHAAGIAQVLRETHARNMVMDGDVSVVETGARTDFLAPSPNVPRYSPAHVDRILHDGDTVVLGPVTLTAHRTAGHTRGTTTWTFPVHLPGDPATQFRNVVIVGGISFWSEFHFVSTPAHRESYPASPPTSPAPSPPSTPSPATSSSEPTAPTSTSPRSSSASPPKAPASFSTPPATNPSSPPASPPSSAPTPNPQGTRYLRSNIPR